MPATETLTVAAFLLARIAEDEAVARASVATFPDADFLRGVLEEYSQPGSQSHADSPHIAHHIARHDPAHILAECKAKRAMVEMAMAVGRNARLAPMDIGFVNTAMTIDRVIRALAAVYESHPDYRPEWSL